MMGEMPRAVQRIVVSGRVQGVYYRVWAKETAQGLGLTGFVRNLKDGSVEILVAGPAHAIEAMTARCQTGPRGADVTRVETSPAADGMWQGFAIRPTARARG